MQMCYETERLFLKILREDAARDVLDFYLDNKEIFEQYEPDRPINFYSLAYQTSLLTCEYNMAANKSALRLWVFEKKAPNKIIGTISFHNILRFVYQSCQIGYKFDQHFWQLGYARESIAQAVAILFREFSLHRIEAMVRPDNIPSVRLLEALGFTNEGVSRRCIYLHGHWTDHLRFSLIHP